MSIRLTIPALDEDVGAGQEPSTGNGGVGEDVTAHREFRMYGDVGPKESSEQWRDRTSEQPLTEWVEDQLGAPESVFLPSVQLVVTGERDTLLEFAFRIRSPSNDIAFDLKRDGDLEVLRHVLLGPNSHLAVVGVWVHALLERRPSNETGHQRCQDR